MNEMTKFLSSFISFISFALRRLRFQVWLSFGGLILLLCCFHVLCVFSCG